MPTFFPYTLQPYAGRTSRYTCPDCGHHREFSRYLDVRTGELLPPEFGKCNRADKCRHHESPYQPTRGRASYYQQMREAERSPLWERPAWQSPHHKHTQLTTTLASPMVSIPSDVVQASLTHYERNIFAQLLYKHFGLDVANDLLLRFRLGTSAQWPGACVFWVLDEQGRARTGKVMLYDETGHRVKKPFPHVDWVHTVLEKNCKRRGQDLPTWLTQYNKQSQRTTHLFGLHQLANAPLTQPVAIVESEKTAVFCTPYLPNYIWLATMGKSNLTAERLAPVQKRHLVLFPDASATDDWRRRAAELVALGFTITVSDWIETNASAEQLAAGYDLADLFLNQWSGYPPTWEV